MWGVPRSELLGRQTQATTEYFYDEDGLLVRSETTWEPRWLPEDVSWAQAWRRWVAGKCPGCGLQLADTTAMRDGEPVHSYHVPDPARCYGCDELLKDDKERAKKPTVRPEALLRHVEQVT
ncbi:hypothetical protein FH608_046055 [Nonomuraea phyllanthi]|uniref:Uncharacterized protein n=1 Tax=Nonomuraea phyllanthi TaxID=2219224 RepID=A0A5C4V640_9ACTN|nr:hypothetical protein [Nonomuraea phyllanthi]KAB8186860.1 hypothetical protein FH608_046055 [Nonomuraea phyllanthi]